jgi:hypothetical protein
MGLTPRKQVSTEGQADGGKPSSIASVRERLSTHNDIVAVIKIIAPTKFSRSGFWCWVTVASRVKFKSTMTVSKIVNREWDKKRIWVAS